MSSNTAMANVVRLVDSYKAQAAFLVPVIVAVGAALASWVVTGNFDATEIRTAVGGAITAIVAAIATYLAPAGQAEVEIAPGQVPPHA